MKEYNNEEFAKICGDKPSNVKVFKKIARDEFGVVKVRENLSDIHIPIFEEAKAIHHERKIKWVPAMRVALHNHIEQQKQKTRQGNINNTPKETFVLKEVLYKLDSIEQLLKKLVEKAS